MQSPSVVIAIAGGTGAGKSHLANQIKEKREERTTVIALDDYFKDRSHLNPEERKEINFDHPDAINWDLFEKQFIYLLDGESIDKPIYEHLSATRRDEQVRIEPAEVLVLEGLYTLYNEKIREKMDLGIYLEVDEDIRLIRRLEQFVIEGGENLDDVLKQYRSDVKPMHEKYVKGSKQYADFIIRNGKTDGIVDLVHRIA